MRAYCLVDEQEASKPSRCKYGQRWSTVGEDRHRDVLRPVCDEYQWQAQDLREKLTQTKEIASIRLWIRNVYRETCDRPAAVLLTAACRRNRAMRTKLTRVEMPESARKDESTGKEGVNGRIHVVILPYSLFVLMRYRSATP